MLLLLLLSFSLCFCQSRSHHAGRPTDRKPDRAQTGRRGNCLPVGRCKVGCWLAEARSESVLLLYLSAVLLFIIVCLMYIIIMNVCSLLLMYSISISQASSASLLREICGPHSMRCSEASVALDSKSVRAYIYIYIYIYVYFLFSAGPRSREERSPMDSA